MNVISSSDKKEISSNSAIPSHSASDNFRLIFTNNDT